ncbi:MAG: hypothetical protein WCQ95_03785 [Bacteroidota bacterium]
MSKKKLPDFVAGLGDSGRATADMAVEAIGNDAKNFEHLLELSFSQPYPTCIRTSHVIQLFCETKPEFILPYLDEIIEKIAVSNIAGVKRSFLKIIAESIDFMLVKDNPTLLQISFDWLLSSKESPAVRYYCIHIITKLCSFEPDLKPEFKATLEFILPESSKGLSNRALKTLKDL